MTTKKRLKLFYGQIVVVATLLIMAVIWGMFYTFGVFFESLLAEFGWTRALISGAFSLSFLLFGFLSIISGRLADRHGPRKVMTVSGLVLGMGYLLMSQINAVWQLYLFYGVIIGVGMSGGLAPLTSTVARWFVKRRGMMTGIVVSGIGVGVVIMPPAAVRLISSYGWRHSYIIVGIIALVLIILAAQFLKRDPRQVGQLAYGEDRLEGKGLDLQDSGFSLQGAIHTRQFWTLGITFLCFGLLMQTIMVHIASHATSLGILAADAANILAIIGGISVAGRIIMGIVADRTGSKLAFIIIFVLMAIALFWLQSARELWMLYLFAIVFGFGYGGESPLRPLIIAELFGLRAHGVIHGAFLIGLTIGGAIGPVMAGKIFDVTNSYQLAFLFSAILAIISLVVVSLLKPTRREDYL